MGKNGYEKHDWLSNELITAAKLDHMEKGIEDAYFRTERQITEIVDNSEELTDMLADRISDFLVEIKQEEEKLIFKLLDKKDN